MGDCLRLLANIFLLFFCSYKSCVYGARELVDHHRAEEVKSLVPPPTCKFPPTSSQGRQTAHGYGACSPIGRENPHPSSHEIPRQEQSRVRALNSMSSSDSGFEAELFMEQSSDFYLVKVGFGTPTLELTLMFDTGSRITWIQCKPCTDRCYHQDEPMYDPLESITFSNASCIEKPDECKYDQDYNDKSHSSGYKVKDTLTISNVQVPEFAFGCGQDNSDNFSGAAGLLALGQDSFLMSQTSFAKMFCYCLPSEIPIGHVVLGTNAFAYCNPEVRTPLLSDHNYYTVGLAGITIGGERLPFGSSMKVIIDSGTPITRLPPKLYADLRDSFQKWMSQYPPAKGRGLFDTCYNLQGYDQIIKPSMILHFDDSNLLLDPSAVIDEGSDISEAACLAFFPNDSDDNLIIIGTHQLRDIKIYIDVSRSSVGFSSGGCN